MSSVLASHHAAAAAANPFNMGYPFVSPYPTYSNGDPISMPMVSWEEVSVRGGWVAGKSGGDALPRATKGAGRTGTIGMQIGGGLESE